MRQRTLWLVVCFGLALLCCVGHLNAQQRTATLVGTIVDPSQAVIPAATVTATRVDTNQKFKAVTSSSGDYALPSLPEGEYVITAEGKGFSTQTKTGVILAVGQTVRIDFNLTVGSTSQTAEVTAQAPLLNTTSAGIGQVISPRMVEALPLNQRDIVALTTLAPGVVPPRGQVQGGNLDTGGYIVRGMRRSDNVIFLNGALMTEGNGSPTFLPNIDAVQEFQIKSGLYGAQYGIMDGGQLVVVTKSGGNRIHGDAFEYLRNNTLDGTNFFQPVRKAFNRNDFGGTFGGPVYIPKLYNGRDKAWFFLSLEKVITHQFSPASAVVPTDAQKQGQFPEPIIDPTTGLNFPGNTIPSGRMNSVAQKFLPFYPEPNTTGSVNYFSPNTTANSTTGQIMVKVDYQQTQNNRWWGQYVRDSTPVPVTSAIQRFTNSQPLGTLIASVGNVHTFAGKYVNDVSFNLFRRPYTETNAPGADCTFPSTLGIPELLTSNVDRCGVPTLSIQGYVGVGDSSLVGPVLTGSWWLPEEFSFQHGKHFVEAGFDWRRQYNLYDLGQRSSFSFTKLYTGDPFANFLLGLPTSTALGGSVLHLNQTMNSLFYWVQDSWRVSPRLTLDLGLRYEYRMPVKDKRGFSANFNPQTGTLYPALQNLVVQPGQSGRFIAGYPLVTFSHLQGFLPRIGLAYRLTDNTVVRAGYSLYAAEPVVGEMQNMGTNPRPGATRLTYTNGFTTPIFTLSNPFPSNLAGQAVPSGAGLENPFKLERSHEWGASLQTAFSQNWLIDIGYDGSHTQNVIEQVNYNDAPPGPGVLQSKRPYPNFAGISYAQSDGDAFYDGLQTKLEKRPGKEGLALLVGYTWSKAIDNTDSRLSIAGENATRSRNMPLSRNRGLSSSNIGQRFVVSADYQLPFGRGRAFATQGIASKLAGGWSLQTITTVQSGPWMTVFVPGDPLNTGDSSSQHPNRLCNPNLSHSQRTRAAWFKTSCFALPTGFVYGNAGRSVVQAPGIVNSDIAVHRVFSFAEAQSLEFRAEAFNSMNHPNFGLPGSSIGTPSFGIIASAHDPREIQFGFKYRF